MRVDERAAMPKISVERKEGADVVRRLVRRQATREDSLALQPPMAHVNWPTEGHNQGVESSMRQQTAKWRSRRS